MHAIFSDLKREYKKLGLLAALGVALSFIFINKTNLSVWLFVVDTLFSIGSVYFIAGLIHLVGNTGMFTSMKFGFKTLFRLFTKGSKAVHSPDNDAYINYKNSREKHKDIKVLMIMAAVFIVFSVILGEILL